MDTLGGTLTIKETQDIDGGDYNCVAVNAAGTSSGKISLDVGGMSNTESEKPCRNSNSENSSLNIKTVFTDENLWSYDQ